MAKGMPWEKFWYQNFMDDLKICSAQTRGFWISFLSYLWGNGGLGDFTGSVEDFSRLSSCNEKEVESSINELEFKKVCEVIRLGNGNVTLLNRRLKREEKERKNIRLRVGEFRKKQKCNDDVRECNTLDDRRKKIEDKNKGILLIGRAEENDNGKSAFSEKLKDEDRHKETFKQIEKLRLILSANGTWKKASVWAQMKIQLQYHPEAVLLALQRVNEFKPNAPEAYADHVLLVESQNFNEADAIKRHDEIKKSTPTLQEALKGAIKNAMSREVP